MLVPYDVNESAAFYGDYYKQQNGGDLPVYSGRPVMGGKGLGSLFSGALRIITPLLKRAGVGLGKRALKTGVRLVGDVARGQNVKSSLKRRARQSGQELLRDLTGARMPAKKKRKMTTRRRAGRRVVI